MRRIADLELAKTAGRMWERGIGLEVATALMDRIVAEGYNEAMGARELRRAVTRLVDDALSDAVLRGEVRARRGQAGGRAGPPGLHDVRRGLARGVRRSHPMRLAALQPNPLLPAPAGGGR